MNKRPWLSNLDMYRKVPGDLLEGSQEGSVVSWAALLFITVLVIRETQEFLSPSLVTDLSLDRSQFSKIKVNFDFTLMDLRCEFATIDAVSVLGNDQNITKDIQRWAVDADLKKLSQRNQGHKKQSSLALFDSSVNHTLDNLRENAVPLDPETFLYALEDHEYVFVDFYAGWCSHCKLLAPTWERFAEVMHDVEDAMEINPQHYSEEEYEKAKQLQLPVLISKVDCVAHLSFCRDQNIRGYPTLRLYVNGESYKDGEYRGDRTIVHLFQYLLLAEERTESALQLLQSPEERTLSAAEGGDGMAIQQHATTAIEKHLNMTKEHQEWADALERTHRHHGLEAENGDPLAHAGCRLAGSLYLNRVPGHFAIQAQSHGLDFEPSMTNLSLVIHSLTFDGADHTGSRRGRTPSAARIGNYSHTVAPLDGKVYVTESLHQAQHFHLKLVATNGEDYQVLANSHLSLYPQDRVPEIKFVLDLSPIAVTYRLRYRHWYDYLTSLLAIIGGTFTVLGIFNSLAQAGRHKLQTTKPKSQYKRPPQRAAP